MAVTKPIDHVRVLCAEIGPRGPTTDGEARAAAYAAAKLEEVGAKGVSVETFRSVPSLWWALEIASALVLASTGVFYFGGGRGWGWPVLLVIAALYIVVAELGFWKLSVSNFLPKRFSQNVFGKIPPKKQSLRKLVVIGHLDTNRTPILFHRRFVRFLPAILVLVIVCEILKVPVFIIGAVGGIYPLSLFVVLVLDIPIAALLIIMIHGDLFSPFTEGANDNATAAAVVLSLAEQFASDPLDHTEFWALCTGCEEATLTGIRAFLDRHNDELRDADFIDLECLGIGELAYIMYEGMLKKYHSNAGLVRAASEAAEVIGRPGITARPLKSGYTETAIVAKRGFRGITIIAMPEGSDDVPHWHQVSDRIHNIDPKNLETAMEFVTAIARDLDS